MKAFISSFSACMLLGATLACAPSFAAGPGKAGDDLDLYAVLETFKQSGNLEEFEKSLNDPDKQINNLDLNGDGDVDYIRVVDQANGDGHSIVLQDVVSEKESQDVAVIEIEKRDGETAVVQVVGDEDLYGKDYIIQPGDQAATAASPVVVNVWAWPSVRYIYGPTYSAWASPWRWSYYPGYWRPWRPVYRHVYYTNVRPYHVYHQRGYTYYAPGIHNTYYVNRVTAPSVRVNTTYRVNRAPAQRNAVAPQQSRVRQQPLQQHTGPRPDHARYGHQGGMHGGGGRRR